MSATISVEKRVGVIVARDGVRYYALFESTIDTKDPKWNCAYFGTGEACMQKIISWARATEGGSLRALKGGLTPSAYIKRTTIADIHHLHGLEFSDSTVSLNLFENAAALQQILDDCQIGAWRLIQSPVFHPYYRHPDVPELGYTVPKAPAASLRNDLLSIESGERFGSGLYYLSRSPEGVISMIGADFYAVQHLIAEVVAPGERAAPGSAENTIRAIRKALKEAKPISLEQATIAYRDDAMPSWRIDNFKRYAAKVGRDAESPVVIATLKEILAADAFYEFQSCDYDAIVFPQPAVLPPKNERRVRDPDLAPAANPAQHPAPQMALHLQPALQPDLAVQTNQTNPPQKQDRPEGRAILRRVRPGMA